MKLNLVASHSNTICHRKLSNCSTASSHRDNETSSKVFVILKISHPNTTCRRNLSDRSTTSSQTGDTELSSKSVASGSDCRASRDSVSNSLHKSASSPAKKTQF